MSKENWTPGPWSYGHGIDDVCDENGMRVCTMTGDVARATHDARLIAAAPELYAVLKKLAEYYLVEYCPVCGESDGAHHCKCALNAALKKARGEF